MSSGRGSGGHGGRRAKKHEEEEHENHERWAVSYADMMTVLVGLFIVLYAMSNVDQVKYEQLRDSLAAGFGNGQPSILEGNVGVLHGVERFEISPSLREDVAAAQAGPAVEDPDAPEEADTTAADARTMRLAEEEYGRLEGIATQIANALDDEGLADRVRFRITERGLFIGMVADDVFFSADAARLTGTAEQVVDTIAPVLVGLDEEISVEGHANVLPSTRYPTNWELSSDRATQVLRRLVETGRVPGERIAAVGFGESRPLDSADDLEANRRVDLVVLSDAPETVRELLPRIAATDPGVT
ncbi:OmpA family protein [Actinotalea sp. BY-33]|uniref:OmpA family protein n=1 Tax=Actinotalea soli TaxID=2819234 RepID=A0A939RTJ2_9CELL|nr:flagellar motor protein MotB [Actinotalea soli]MBO1751269.1 OmpA family protein [Actinotalea soli]